jgi:arabinogalactan endo-1,4-beta-galactosidase
MTKDECETMVHHVTEQLGNEAVGFFTTIHGMERFFLEADEQFTDTPTTVEEFEDIGCKIAALLGEAEASRLFRAIFETLPTQTVYYLSILVKLFELGM